MNKPAYHITTLNEKPLHAALKQWYARPGDHLEIYVDGFLVDLVRPDCLVEIQTRGLGKIRRKLEALAEHHRVRLVYPIAAEKWIVRVGKDGQPIGRRKSPRRGRVEDVFHELVGFPSLLTRPNLSLEVVLIREEEVRRQGPARNWRRRGWGTHERRLIEVVERRRFDNAAALARLVPPGMSEPFSTADLAAALGITRFLAQRMAYCLRRMNVLIAVGKKGNAILYRRACAT